MKRYLPIVVLSYLSCGLPAVYACVEANDVQDQTPQREIVQDPKGSSAASDGQAQANASDKKSDASKADQTPANGAAKG